jgi:hypothetical protein
MQFEEYLDLAVAHVELTDSKVQYKQEMVLCNASG